MKQLFLIGDFYSDNGPGIANKALLECLKYQDVFRVSFSQKKDKIGRFVELVSKLWKTDCICICSFSQLNYLIIYLCRFLCKPILYIAHGYVQYEDELNRTEKKTSNKRKKLESFTFENVDKIICVSPRSMKFIGNHFEQYGDKFTYIYNFVERKHLAHVDLEGGYSMMSVGGGMPRKANIEVCRAIASLIEQGKLAANEISYVIVGPDWDDGEKIRCYPFVKYYKSLSHAEVLKLMSESELYIQNSIFETFCLAVLEAIDCGCKLLAGKNIGALDLLDHLDENNIIGDYSDISELAEKIMIQFHTMNKIEIREVKEEDIAQRFAAIAASVCKTNMKKID